MQTTCDYFQFPFSKKKQICTIFSGWRKFYLYPSIQKTDKLFGLFQKPTYFRDLKYEPEIVKSP